MAKLMAHPEQEVRDRAKLIFDMRNIAEMSKRTGYAPETLRRWKRAPLGMKAVDLFRLEHMLGLRKEEKRK